MTRDDLKSRMLRILQNASVNDVVDVLANIQEETADGLWDEGNCNAAKNVYLIRDVLDAIRCVTDVDINRALQVDRIDSLLNMNLCLDKIIVD